MREISLEERKEISLNILGNIDSILNHHGIRYYLAYGTLIGAVRHKGFIPWDDDIDIWIAAKDMESALAAIKMDSQYDVLSIYDESTEWNRPFAKISDANTAIIRKDGRKTEKRGVAVDVFPLMNLYGDKQYQGISKSASMIQRFSEYRLGNFSGGGIKNLLRRTYLRLSDILGKNESFWVNKLKQLENQKGDTEYIGCPISPYGSKDRFLKKDFSDIEIVEFENKKFPICCGWDNVLSALYGNYMELPPEDKRISNHSVIACWKGESNGENN